jgi:ribosomal protein L7/L12
MKKIEMTIEKLDSGFLVAINDKQHALTELGDLTELVNTKFREKETFVVWFTDIDPNRRIPCIKVIREHTGLGLKEAKECTDRPYQALPLPFSLDAAKALELALNEYGAKVEIKSAF